MHTSDKGEPGSLSRKTGVSGNTVRSFNWQSAAKVEQRNSD